VGFLGAGTIFRSEQGSVVSGITTAASLLMAASIGISAGLHRYSLAIAATLLTLVVLLAVSAVEKRLRKGETAGE
jgi:putative Mg2+ transporter-C (MgtC) family protein